jgi:hypothetical protein
MAPSVEKPTAITASSAHSSKTGTLARASLLRTNRSNPTVASAKETAHTLHESQAALFGLLPPLSRAVSNRRVPFLLLRPVRYQY